MNPRLQMSLAGLLNPILLVPSIIITFWVCSVIAKNHRIDVIKSECKQLREP